MMRKLIQSGKKSVLLLVSLLVILLGAAGGTLALLRTDGGTVTNTFTPAKVTTKVAAND